MQREIFLVETKPYPEWIMGREVRKVSGTLTHGTLQGEFGSLLRSWAKGRGLVGLEWTFRVSLPGEVIRPLVPDIAYVSYLSCKKIGAATKVDLKSDLDSPLIPPDVVVEIRAPEDRQDVIDHKIGVYLAAGTNVVIIVDPMQRTIEAHDRDGVSLFRTGQTFTHPALPELQVDIAALFNKLRFPRHLGLSESIKI